LFGSRKFVDTYPNEKIQVVLNYDMISRDDYTDKKGNNCSLIYTKAFPEIGKTTKKNNTEANLNLNINYAPMEKPIGGSDNSSFAKKDIPVFWFFIGNHIDYHRPSDHLEKANWAKFTKIVKLGFLNVWDFANSENGISTKN
jgi:Zn-dependent M28 family amino/carboxypeptidase